MTATLPATTLRRAWPLVAATLALMTAIAVESFAVTTVMPLVAADLGGPAWFSLATAATVTTGLVGTVIGGAWTDRSGTTAPRAVGGLLFVGGILMCVAADDMGTFVVGRLVQGFGGGIDAVVVYVVIATQLPEELRPRMFGLLATAWLVPSIAGPLAAGSAATTLGGAACSASSETFEADWLDGASEPAVGVRFRGHVRRNGRGPTYWSTCRVTACVPDREFGFEVLLGDRPVNNWHYRLDPVGTGTDVTESFRLAPGPGTRIYWALLGRARGRTNRRNMRKTLRRLRAIAEPLGPA